MKITIEPYSGGCFTADNDAEHISKVVTMFKGLLVQAGYHPQTVDDQFTEEIETWFPESESEPDEVALPPGWSEEQAENCCGSDQC